MAEPTDVDRIREVPINELRALWPIPGQRAQERIKIGNTVSVDADQWLVTSVRVSTAIIQRQPPQDVEPPRQNLQWPAHSETPTEYDREIFADVVKGAMERGIDVPKIIAEHLLKSDR